MTDQQHSNVHWVQCTYRQRCNGKKVIKRTIKCLIREMNNCFLSNCCCCCCCSFTFLHTYQSYCCFIFTYDFLRLIYSDLYFTVWLSDVALKYRIYYFIWESLIKETFDVWTENHNEMSLTFYKYSFVCFLWFLKEMIYKTKKQRRCYIHRSMKRIIVIIASKLFNL